MALATLPESCGLGQAAAPPTILVIPSGAHPAYGQLVSGLRERLATRQGAPVLAVGKLEDYRIAQRDSDRATHFRLLVTAGMQAAEQIVRSPPPLQPVLHTLVPRLALRRLALDKEMAGASAIYLDQPMARQFALIRSALPKARRVAVLLGPASRAVRGEILEAAQAAGLAVNIETVLSAHELHRALTNVLDGADALLAVADTLVYNPRTIHHILLSTYHHKVPMVGISRGHLEAGATLALYSTPQQIGRQAAEMILEAFAAPDGPRLPPPQFPRYFTVEVNERVAASLGLRLPSRESLQQALEHARP